MFYNLLVCLKQIKYFFTTLEQRGRNRQQLSVFPTYSSPQGRGFLGTGILPQRDRAAVRK